MRILVADDEPDLRRLCRTNLKLLGHSVLEAADGEHAIQVAAHERPDLIILDLMMPYRDGLSVLVELAQLPETEGIPVVLLSARSGLEDQLEGWEAGAAEYLTKPFSPHDLARAIDRVVAMAPQERERHRETNLALLEGILRKDEEGRGGGALAS